MKVVIIGGGITGLAAAFRLQTLIPTATITLFERDQRLGGKLRTDETDSFIIEGGADSFLSRKSRGVGLCRDLGLQNRLIGRDPRHQGSFVRHQGRLHLLPEGFSGFVPTRLEALENSELLSAAGKARLAQEPQMAVREGPEDESIADFIGRRLGHEAYDRLVEPLMSGIYAGDGTQLSLMATYPQLRELERQYGSLIKGLSAAEAAAPQPYPPFVSFPLGMGELITTLAGRLSTVELITGVEATRLTADPAGYKVRLNNDTSVTATVVILATPAHVTARLVAPLDPCLAQLHQAIPYVSAVTVNLAYQAADLLQPLEGYGYVIPRKEGGDVLACTWSSNKWAGRAPDGTLLVRVYLGRYGGGNMVQLADDQLLQLARTELSQTLRLTADPLFYQLYRWPLAMPQYTLGHLERVAAIDSQLAHHPGLFAAGAAYRGVGIPDCIASGETAAENTTSFLTTQAQGIFKDTDSPR